MERFEWIAAHAQNSEVQFEREIRCKIYSLDNERILVMTEMHDYYHKIEVAFTCAVEIFASSKSREYEKNSQQFNLLLHAQL